MDITQKVSEIANNHDCFAGLTRDRYTCKTCNAKAPATIFEAIHEGIYIAVLCCSACGFVLDIETNRME